MTNPTTPQAATKPPTKRRLHLQPIEVLKDDAALLNMHSAATWSGMSISTLYRAEADGRLKLTRIGARCTRVRAGELRRFMASLG